jgi:hypothetical protein
MAPLGWTVLTWVSCVCGSPSAARASTVKKLHSVSPLSCQMIPTVREYMYNILIVISYCAYVLFWLRFFNGLSLSYFRFPKGLLYTSRSNDKLAQASTRVLLHAFRMSYYASLHIYMHIDLNYCTLRP